MSDNSRFSFSGRVALVTGAGAGLGKAYALLLAKLGCKVVVNDLKEEVAKKCAEEIKALGGSAFPVGDSVVGGGPRLVQATIDAYGRLDILINNAGIIQDVSFNNMADADWDIIYKIHLEGVYSCTKAAWPHMSSQKYGRIINVSSATGLYGNFGQVNYSAAKSALIGFSKSLAKEGERKNILVNVVAPLAVSQLTQKLIPEDFKKNLTPESVAPFVVYMCHESFQETGQVLEMGAGWAAKVRTQRAPGVSVPMSKLSLGEIEKSWAKISDFEGADEPSAVHESIGRAVTAAQEVEGAKTDSAQLKSEKLFQLMTLYFAHAESRGPQLCDKVKGVYKFQIFSGKKVGQGDSKMWTIDLKNKPGSCKEGEAGSADCTFKMTDADFIALSAGKLQPQMAFMQGKMKLQGNMGAAMRFTPDALPKVPPSVNLDKNSIEEVVDAVIKAQKSKL